MCCVEQRNRLRDRDGDRVGPSLPEWLACHSSPYAWELETLGPRSRVG